MHITVYIVLIFVGLRSRLYDVTAPITVDKTDSGRNNHREPEESLISLGMEQTGRSHPSNL